MQILRGTYQGVMTPNHQNNDGQHAIAINDQWRICFRFDDGDAFDVQVCDYH